jgi:glycosyltransferase involved in cell wall biosynthesis
MPGAEVRLVRCVHYLSQIRLEAGGVVRAALDFCGIFAAMGNPTTLVTGDPTDVPAEWLGSTKPNIPKVVVIDPPTGRFALLPRSGKGQFRQALQDAQVLHLHTPWEPSNLQAASMAGEANIPYVLTPHGMLDDWSMTQKRTKKRAYLTVVGNRLLARAARIHCTAQAELDQARKWLSVDNGVVIPLVMDLAPFESLPGPELAQQRFAPLRTEDVKLLFLSRVHPKKGVDLLIRAAAELQKRGRKITLFIAGPHDPHYIDQLKQLATGLGIADKVHFPGMVRGQEKLSLYQAADLFVLPTSQENFGLVLLEAMGCRLPVITTQGVDIWKELCEAGATIIERDPFAIASAIETMLADPHLHQRGEQGRAWVMDKMNPQRVAAQYQALYQQISDEAGTGNP